MLPTTEVAPPTVVPAPGVVVVGVPIVLVPGIAVPAPVAAVVPGMVGVALVLHGPAMVLTVLPTPVLGRLGTWPSDVVGAVDTPGPVTPPRPVVTLGVTPVVEGTAEGIAGAPVVTPPGNVVGAGVVVVV